MTTTRTAPPTAAAEQRLAGLVAAVDRLTVCPLDELGDPDLKAELATLETQLRRLQARQTRIVATLDRRCRAAAEATATARRADPVRARERASRGLQDELAETTQWEQGRVKAASRLGRQAEDDPRLGADLDAGRLPAANAELLADTLAKLPAEVRDRLEPDLLAAARTETPSRFGRTCRQALADHAHDTAMADADRRHAARRATVSLRPDGMTALSGQWAGIDGELVHTVVHAFRTPDAPGQHRSPEQRTADALAEAFRTALRHADAPATHGVRPHITVTVPVETLRTHTGSGQAAWTGPIPYGELHRLLADAGVARVLVDARGLPLEASEEVRTVPVGLYRFLLVRDGGCIAEGCTAPAAWCDVMHLATPHRDDGRLAPDNAALGCRHHHRLYDRHGWQLTWHDGRPTLRPPPSRAAGPDP